MKTLITLLITVFTWTASANTIIAKYDFGSAPGFSNQGKFVQSTLSENGDLVIEIYSDLLQGSVARPAADQIVTAQISEKNLKTISDLTAGLVSAEIIEVEMGIICMLMPSDFMMSDHLYLNRAYDFENKQFTGKLALVLGPEGCWVSHRVNLAKKWDNVSARKIKSILEVLVNEHAGDLL